MWRWLSAFWLILSSLLWVACPSDTSMHPDTSETSPTSIDTMTTAQRTPQKSVEVLDLTEEVALYILVAGAYSTPEGAQKKVKDLRKMGLSNADVIQRPGSKLYSAVVERFDNQEDADLYAKDLLSNKEIKSYVYKVE